MGEIALRAHLAPDRTPRRRRSAGQWPTVALLVTTLPVQASGEPLWIGASQLLADTAPSPARPQLFYRDNLPAADVAALTAYCTQHKLPGPITRSDWLKVLYQRSYKQRLPLVSFCVPAVLSHLAMDWQPGMGHYKDGFSMILWTRRPTKRSSKPERRRRKLLRNGQVENGDRPRIRIVALDGHRAFIAFTRRRQPDEEDMIPEGGDGRADPRYVFPGRWVSLQQFAFGLSGEVPGDLPSLLKRFDLDPAAEPNAAGDIGAHADHARWELACLAAGYRALLTEHREHAPDDVLPPDRVYSPASYADAMLQTARYNYPSQKWDIDPSVLGTAMEAYFGGDSMVAHRRPSEPLAVTTVDIKSEYVAVQHLLGVPDLLRAQNIEVIQRDPAELTTFIAGLTLDRLLDPKTWRDVGFTFVHIVSDGDVLPHKRRAGGEALQLRVAPLTCSRPIPFHLADAIDSHLETGRVPKIVSGFTLLGDGTQPGLRAATLATGRVIEPHDDPFLALAQERVRLDRRADLADGQRRRWGRLYKLAANSGTSGLFAQVNPAPNSTGRRTMWQPDGTSHPTAPGIEEEPGRWYFPPIAAAVTAGGRLLLHLAKTLVEDAGGTAAYWDTDSLAIPTSPDGFTAADIEAVRERLERLSPYAPDLRPQADILVPTDVGWVPSRVRRPLFLQLEDENFDGGPAWPQQAHVHAISSKNYDLYTVDRAGAHVEIHDGQPVVIEPSREPLGIRIAKASHHTFGHLLDPRTGHPADPTDSWVEIARDHQLRTELGLPTKQLDWLDRPALSLILLNHPDELARLDGFNRRRPNALRPWSKVVIGHPLHRKRDADGKRITPAAAWHDGFTVASAHWRDLTTGKPIKVKVASEDLLESDLAPDGVIVLQTIRMVIASAARRPETKAVTPGGDACRSDTRGPLVPAPTDAYKVVLIGRENHNLDRVGITEDPKYTILSDPGQDAWETLIRPTLKDLAPRAKGGVAAVADGVGVARSTLERALKTGRANRPVRGMLLPIAGDLACRALADLRPGRSLPADPEHACHLYLRHSGQLAPLTCLSCGKPLAGRQRKWCSTCRESARKRLVAV